MKADTFVLALVVLIICLVVVGFESGTPVRHAIQVCPAVLALLLAWTRHSWGAAASLPLFLFWMAISVLIWLHQLKIAHVITGKFTLTEIIITVIIFIAGLAGSDSSWRGARPMKGAGRVLLFLLFAALQWGALLLSRQPQFAHR
ncbi:MAG TPA: hypothetical protein VJA94_05435 [Candidatus Angelobacter sp.]